MKNTSLFPNFLLRFWNHTFALFVVTFLCFSPGTGGESVCGLQFSPPKAAVMFGGSVSVNCSSSGSYNNIGWEVSDGDSNNDNPSLAIWTVSKLSQWDVKPMCYGMKWNGVHCSEDYSFIVYKTPNSVSIRASHAGAMMEGNQYELQCDVQDVAPVQFLTVKWYKGQKVVNVTNFTDTIKTPVNQAATIVIRADRDDDGAQYRCEAELLAEELNPPLNISSKPLNITVHSRPIINETKLSSEVIVRRGDRLMLVCEAEGNPKPTISWSFRENVLVREEQLQKLVTEFEDDGFYYCTAVNSAGSVSRSVRVTVIGLKDVFIRASAGAMMEGNQYLLQCDVQDVAPVQFLTVKWYKGQKVVNVTSFTDAIKTPVNQAATIVIRPDRDDDGAQYRCEAELLAEKLNPPLKISSKPLNISVHFQPIINETKLSSEVIVRHGHRLRLVCEAEGNPKPTISWSFRENVLVREEQLQKLKTEFEDNGFYYCTAVNSAGSVSRSVRVTVIGGGKNNETGNCHLEFSPPKAVVMFGGSVSVNCSSSGSYGDIGWEVSDGYSNKNDPSLAIWTVSKLSQWDVKPMCYGMKNGEPCSEDYSFIVYKTPNSVSIRASHAGAMMEGKQYELKCDVQDVAPVQFLTVKWYKGQKVVNVTSFTDAIKTPVNQAATIVIRPDRDDDGAQYRCEAELLAEELQTPLNISSEPLNITVHFKPIINETKLPSVVPVFRDNPVVLVCEAEGNPKPTISWSPRENVVINGGNITITEKTLNPLVCTANNSAGNISREVQVVVKEDYLPLLAGLVALTVAVISVIFVFIYSIYYKTAKMGHYSLKNVKTNAQNGNIAQSGKDNSIPMKKLSQSSILA